MKLYNIINKIKYIKILNIIIDSFWFPFFIKNINLFMPKKLVQNICYYVNNLLNNIKFKKYNTRLLRVFQAINFINFKVQLYIIKYNKIFSKLIIFRHKQFNTFLERNDKLYQLYKYIIILHKKQNLRSSYYFYLAIYKKINQI